MKTVSRPTYTGETYPTKNWGKTEISFHPLSLNGESTMSLDTLVYLSVYTCGRFLSAGDKTVYVLYLSFVPFPRLPFLLYTYFSDYKTLLFLATPIKLSK